MKLIWRYMRELKGRIALGMTLKLLGTLGELMIPYVMEHLIDTVAPRRDLRSIILWGVAMLLMAFLVRTLNVTANRMSVSVAEKSTYRLRLDLFRRSLHLSGSQVDAIGLPSLISRMTSDSYNIQSFMQSVQTLGIRAPIMLLGGICVTLTMDVGLASILCVLAPLMLVVVVGISLKGVPLYEKVQQRMDDIVRIMRENITGIRVVKALSKEEHERARYGEANEAMTRQDRKAGIVMALPGPLLTLALNIGLTLVVLVGARRVDAGLTQPGVILAFLTYFNMILMGVMALTRIFLLMSKANASALRCAVVMEQPEELRRLPESELGTCPERAAVVFDHVSFHYGSDASTEERRMAVKDLSFSIAEGGSLGIIGATGSGKTTIIRLLMRFYDVTSGHVYVDGKDVRGYELDDLRRKFGVVFQNDMIFADTLRENICLGRAVDDDGLRRAAEDARAWEFISAYDDVFDHEAAIHGADLSGGQRQRVLISRALAADPHILILDDASSALDYRTDAALRKAVREHHAGSATIVIAQRVSSIMSLDRILYLEDGVPAGYGTHAELMASCPAYRQIYETQMGEGGSEHAAEDVVQ